MPSIGNQAQKSRYGRSLLAGSRKAGNNNQQQKKTERWLYLEVDGTGEEKTGGFQDTTVFTSFGY